MAEVSLENHGKDIKVRQKIIRAKPFEVAKTLWTDVANRAPTPPRGRVTEALQAAHAAHQKPASFRTRSSQPLSCAHFDFFGYASSASSPVDAATIEAALSAALSNLRFADATKESVLLPFPHFISLSCVWCLVVGQFSVY